MTKRRAPDSIEDAVTQALAILGDAGASAATGKSARLVRQWGDPDADAHQIQHQQALRLDLACIAEGEAPPFHTHFAEQIRRATQKAGGTLHPVERLAEVMAEVGDVAAAVRAGLLPSSPGGSRFTHDEAATLRRELAELRAVLDCLDADVVAALTSAAGA